MSQAIKKRDNILLRVEDIKKSYGEFTALHPISLEIAYGEFHALVGENGAGKSTLINIITGVVQSDTGYIEFKKEKITSLNPTNANERGIYTVHQELSLCPSLSIADNIFLGRNLNSFLGVRNKKEINKTTRALLNDVGLNHLIPEQKVSSLTLAEQQLVEFIKAFYEKPSLLILDEATSALDSGQVKILFDKIRERQKNGMAVIFISHRLHELFILCHKMTVLKDGKQIVTDNINKYNNNDLIKLMTGREFSDLYPEKDVLSKKKRILKVNNLSTDKIKNINFTLYEGEILGIGGLQGQGQEEVLKALFGVARIEQGNIELDNKKINFKKPSDAMRHRIAYLPSDRTSESLLLEHSVLFNSTLSNLQEISGKTKTILVKKEQSLVKKAMEKMQVAAQSMNQTVGSLSGGNQQKIALIKWLERNPRVLLLNEPTRGIDVGTKKEIYELLRKLTRNGISIIVISSEALELIGLCDRIAVMYEFKINDVIEGENLTEEHLVRTSILKRGENFNELVK